MGEYSHSLPQLRGGLFLTDGGLETTLVFHDQLELPAFAAFDLLKNEDGTARLRRYYEQYFDIARRNKTGFLLESPTWRSNPDWAARIGYSPERTDEMNQQAISMLHDIRTGADYSEAIVISGCIGPRDDGYDPAKIMTPAEAQDYHSRQIGIFDDAGADLVSAITMTNVPEAVGIVRAASARGLPSVISFTVETDGRLPTDVSLQDAIESVDRVTDGGPAYYMINCAHPTHFEPALSGGQWQRRIRGLRANASRLSHAELDSAEQLDDGDPHELADQYRSIRERLPHINVLGGCCGTDHRHVEAIAERCH